MTHNSIKALTCTLAVLAAFAFSGCGGSGDDDTYQYGYSAGEDFAARGYGADQCAITARNSALHGLIPLGTESEFIEGCSAALDGR